MFCISDIGWYEVSKMVPHRMALENIITDLAINLYILHNMLFNTLATIESSPLALLNVTSVLPPSPAVVLAETSTTYPSSGSRPPISTL